MLGVISSAGPCPGFGRFRFRTFSWTGARPRLGALCCLFRPVQMFASLGGAVAPSLPCLGFPAPVARSETAGPHVARTRGGLRFVNFSPREFLAIAPWCDSAGAFECALVWRLGMNVLFRSSRPVAACALCLCFPPRSYYALPARQFSVRRVQNYVAHLFNL